MWYVRDDGHASYLRRQHFTYLPTSLVIAYNAHIVRLRPACAYFPSFGTYVQSAVDRDWLAVACHPITLLLLWGRPWTKQLQRRLQSDVKFPPERHLYGRTRENGSKAPTFRTTPTSKEAIEFLMTIPIFLSLSPSFSSFPYNTHHTRNTISVHSFHVIAFRMDDKEFDRILPLDPVSHSAFLQLVGLPSQRRQQALSSQLKFIWKERATCTTS